MRRTWQTILSTVAIAALLSSASFVAGFRSADPPPSGFDEIVQTAQELRDRAARPVSDRELVDAAIQGMLDALGDPYANLLAPPEEETIDRLVDGSIVGIGVWLDVEDRGLRITQIVPDTPAERAGLRAGDLILSVDGHTLAGLGQDGTDLLRGEAGSVARLQVERDDRERSVEVRRARIHVPNVSSRTLASGVGYVRLYQFGDGAAEDLRAALEDLLGSGARGIVLDLRDNPGGLADEAYDAASLFIEDGVIATIRQRGRSEYDVRASGDALPDFPLGVLVNGGSASASEILAGALKDRGRGLLVGERTYGKGSVLTVESLSEDTTIQFTTAFFFSPSG
ncbi:MAG TPA: S41 family peptidase, partial [Actinomycetota bacterium]|nr:S41 family peptidase [Actinomycetota bacterium]